MVLQFKTSYKQKFRIVLYFNKKTWMAKMVNEIAKQLDNCSARYKLELKNVKIFCYCTKFKM